MRLTPVAFTATVAYPCSSWSTWPIGCLRRGWAFIDLRNMATSLALLPIAPLGVWIGIPCIRGASTRCGANTVSAPAAWFGFVVRRCAGSSCCWRAAFGVVGAPASPEPTICFVCFTVLLAGRSATAAVAWVFAVDEAAPSMVGDDVDSWAAGYRASRQQLARGGAGVVFQQREHREVDRLHAVDRHAFGEGGLITRYARRAL